MSWFWTLIIFLSFTFFTNKLSEAKHPPNKLPSTAAVVGAVYCDTCFLPKANHFIAGATVAVECKSSSSRPRFRQEVKTNGRGEFRVELPFSVGKHVKQIRGCSVALISSNEPSCAAATSSSPLRLKSRNAGERIFSAGFFTFKPQVCDQKQISSESGGDRKPISTKMAFFLPPNPLNPPIIPPNPLLPPPSLIPPVLPTPSPSVLPPFFPTPPPSVIPPILPTPPSSPAPFLPLPKIPGLSPSQSPPPPPSFPVPLPPVPGLPPIPGLPIPPVPGLPVPPVAGLPSPGLPIPPTPGLPVPPVPGLPLPPVPGLPIPPTPGLPVPPVPGLPIPPTPGIPVPPTPGLPIPPVPGIPIPPVPGLPIPGLPGGPPAQMRKSHP